MKEWPREYLGIPTGFKIGVCTPDHCSADDLNYVIDKSEKRITVFGNIFCMQPKAPNLPIENYRCLSIIFWMRASAREKLKRSPSIIRCALHSRATMFGFDPDSRNSAKIRRARRAFRTLRQSFSRHSLLTVISVVNRVYGVESKFAACRIRHTKVPNTFQRIVM